MRLTASAASNPDGTGTSSRRQGTNSAYAPLIGSGGNHPAWFDSRDTVAEPIHHANQA
jgi:hypothetical protein